MSIKYEVIIIGAGPSGAVAAYTLAKSGIFPLLIEKDSISRYKVCGGGLQHRVLDIMPFDISEVIEDTINNLTFTCQLANATTLTSEKPLIYCVKREKFDAFLTKKAIEAGAKLIENEAVISISSNNNQFIVRSDLSEYQADIIIGADGSNSVVAKSLGLMQNVYKSFAIQREILVNEKELIEHRGRISVDLGTLPSGYAWLFPKADRFSIGVGGPMQISKSLKPYLSRYLNFKGLKGHESYVFRGHVLPTRNLAQNIVKNRALLVGDAAGLVDAFTGEGIYQAVLSGKLAAQNVVRFLSNQTNSFSDYEKEVEESIMKDILASRFLMNIFNSAPKTAHRLVKHNYVWERVCRVLRGDKTTEEVKKKLGLLAEPIHLIASAIANKKLTEFEGFSPD